MKTLKCAGSSNEVVVVVVVVVCSAAFGQRQHTMDNVVGFSPWLASQLISKLSSSNKAKTYNNKPHAQLRMEMLVKWKRRQRKRNQKKRRKKNIAHFKMSVECDN